MVPCLARSVFFLCFLCSFWPLSAVRAGACELDRPIVFAGYEWESNDFHTEVARFVFEQGYLCETEKIIGSTIMLVNGLLRGDIDVSMELWPTSVEEIWKEAEKKGRITLLGASSTSVFQGWFIPRYLVEGENAPAKGLKSVSDLPRFKSLFQDPEEPEKGRFYGCLPGWKCDVLNAKKFKIYGLDKDFVNYRPGTGAALVAAIESHLKRKKPVVFHYWMPSALMGLWSEHLIVLEEEPYSKEVWNEFQHREDPVRTTHYPIGKIFVSATREFQSKAPTLAKFLQLYKMEGMAVARILARMSKEKTTAREEAIRFLRTDPSWQTWVPDEVAARIKARIAKDSHQ